MAEFAAGKVNRDAAAAPRIKKRRQSIDLPFLVIVVLLSCFGLVMLFTASYAKGFYDYGDSYFFIRDQLKWMLLGFAGMIGISFVDYRFIRKFALPSLGVAIVLLILVLIIGKPINDVQRWIIIGNISVQPSEIAKLAVVLSFSHCIARYQKYMKSLVYGIVPYAAVLAVIAFLLYKEPHLSCAILILGTGFILLVVGGANLAWLGGAAAVGAAGMAGVIFFTSYARSRITVWLDPWVDPVGKGFQTIQSLYAVGSGGLMGLGLGRSRQKFLYLPEPQNDFIFSIACEELGFIGALVIMLLFALLIWRGFLIAFRAPDKYSCLVVVGIISKTALQIILNIAVVTNTVPNTGISLPFFSSGGSALCLLLVEMGMVLGISKFARTEKS